MSELPEGLLERDEDRCCALKPGHEGCCAYKCSLCGGRGRFGSCLYDDVCECLCGLCDGYGTCLDCGGEGWTGEDGGPCTLDAWEVSGGDLIERLTAERDALRVEVERRTVICEQDCDADNDTNESAWVCVDHWNRMAGRAFKAEATVERLRGLLREVYLEADGMGEWCPFHDMRHESAEHPQRCPWPRVVEEAAK